ncbi:MAG: sulfite exporter TauE/SafE family protein [Sphingomonadales bacterium]|nr:MAG: sulfite exporter TauE/SafE family protein [Sphingomonadales bacterium]
MDLSTLLFAFAAGILGGAMNALAGGGTFATLPALIAMGLPSNVANATSNVALLPGAGASAYAYRDELAPIGGLSVKTLAIITFAGGLIGSVLLAITPSRAFDLIIPWLLLFAFAVMVFGKRASDWLHARVTIGRPTLITAQSLLGIYGGYFGGGVGLITTAVYGLLAGAHPRSLFAIRTLMLATANLAAAFVFIATGLVKWWACLPVLAGGILGGWLGARLGKRLPHWLVRAWTLLITGATTIVFFVRAYG